MLDFALRMFTRLRDDLGIAGLIAVAVLALVMLGVGYAARGEGSESGQSWPSDSKLPAGATLTGGWAFSTEDPGEILVPLSFPMQLPVEALLIEKVHFQSPGGASKAETKEFEDACGPPASGAVNPKADPGHLCVYHNPFGGLPVNATFSRITPLTRLERIAPEEWATDSAGAALRFTFTGSPGDTAKGAGTFAVTAPVGE
jgi:hypothetical protein